MRDAGRTIATMNPTTATTARTADVIEQFNRAFQTHDASLLDDLVADDCVMESVEPAPNGTRFEGGDVCLAFWRALAVDGHSRFQPEDVLVAGERATIRWRYRFGDDDAASVRGVNLMHVRDGKIVEALGYVKSGAADVAAALDAAVN